jgi:hypothetical protein
MKRILEKVKAFFVKAKATSPVGTSIPFTGDFDFDPSACQCVECEEAPETQEAQGESQPEETQPPKAKEYLEADFIAVKMPTSYARFIKTTKKDDFYGKFFSFLAKLKKVEKVYGPRDGRLMNVSTVWLTDPEEKKLARSAKKWAIAQMKKKYGFVSRTKVDSTFAWYHLEISPASFRLPKDGGPKWAKKGFAYVQKENFYTDPSET